MKEVLEFIFSSFWTWLGTFALLAVFVKWRLFYFGINIGTSKGQYKKTSEDTNFWKQLSEIGKKDQDKDKGKDKK